MKSYRTTTTLDTARGEDSSLEKANSRWGSPVRSCQTAQPNRKTGSRYAYLQNIRKIVYVPPGTPGAGIRIVVLYPKVGIEKLRDVDLSTPGGIWLAR